MSTRHKVVGVIVRESIRDNLVDYVKWLSKPSQLTTPQHLSQDLERSARSSHRKFLTFLKAFKLESRLNVCTQLFGTRARLYRVINYVSQPYALLSHLYLTCLLIRPLSTESSTSTNWKSIETTSRWFIVSRTFLWAFFEWFLWSSHNKVLCKSSASSERDQTSLTEAVVSQCDANCITH